MEGVQSDRPVLDPGEIVCSPDGSFAFRIVEHIGEGLTNKQIADQMFLAEKTVKNYVSRLLEKLGMQRRTQAAALISNHHARTSRTEQSG